jgi:hypothetical protein
MAQFKVGLSLLLCGFIVNVLLMYFADKYESSALAWIAVPVSFALFLLFLKLLRNVSRKNKH